MPGLPYRRGLTIVNLTINNTDKIIPPINRSYRFPDTLEDFILYQWGRYAGPATAYGRSPDRRILIDPAEILSDAETDRHAAHAAEDTGAIDREIRALATREDNFAAALGAGLIGPARERIVAMMNDTATLRGTLESRKAEVLMNAAVLTRRTDALRDWVEALVEGAEAIRGLDFAGRQDRLRRLVLDVTVNYRGSESPRYEVAVALPVPEGDLWPDAVLTDDDADEAERQSARWALGPGGETRTTSRIGIVV